MSRLAPNVTAAFLPSLAQIYQAIEPLATAQYGELYLDGTLSVRHPDGFTVGRFVMEDEWWIFEVGEDP
jgi:hypothetical protein